MLYKRLNKGLHEKRTQQHQTAFKKIVGTVDRGYFEHFFSYMLTADTVYSKKMRIQYMQQHVFMGVQSYPPTEDT